LLGTLEYWRKATVTAEWPISFETERWVHPNGDSARRNGCKVKVEVEVAVTTATTVCQEQ